MKNEIYFAKLNEKARIPNKRLEDAGYDVYTTDTHAPIIFEPHETRLIPTGICSSFSSDLVAVVKNISKGEKRNRKDCLFCCECGIIQGN